MDNSRPQGIWSEREFSDAVVKYRERIFLVMLKFVRNREDARDLTQEAFLRAYRSRRAFRGESSVYTWIYRIAINLALNFKQRSRESLLETIQDGQASASGIDPSEKVSAELLMKEVDVAVKSLPNRQRMVFVLRYHEEKPFAEIAADMGITEGAAKANYHHAVKKLQVLLRPQIKGDRS